MSHAGRVALLAPLVLALGTSTAAGDEGESALSVDASFATFTVQDRTGVGGALGVEYERGLSDAFWLRAAATGGYYPIRDGKSYSGYATVGLTYVVDILKYVPYLYAGAGGVVLGGDALDAEVHPIGEIGAGLDILAHRGRSYGVFARLGSFLDESAFFTLGARMTWRWGFF